jgi:hypothetical protein
MKMIVASRGAAVADEAAFLPKANIARCPTLLQQPRAKAFMCCKHIRVPQAFVQGTISAGNHGPVRQKWNELTNLLIEDRMLSLRLRAVLIANS